jgi:hypothetical protein
VKSPAPLVSVRLTKDGVWSVNERCTSRVAIDYFPSQWAAMRHAVRVARARRRCRVALLGPGGAVRASRDYAHGEEKP